MFNTINKIKFTINTFCNKLWFVDNAMYIPQVVTPYWNCYKRVPAYIQVKNKTLDSIERFKKSLSAEFGSKPSTQKFHWLSMLFWVVCAYVFDRILIPHMRKNSSFTIRMATCSWNFPVQSKNGKNMCIFIFDVHMTYTTHEM